MESPRVLCAVLAWSMSVGPLSASSALASAAASAKETDEFPLVSDLGGKRLQLNGTAVRRMTIFRVRIYEMALYVEARSADPQSILQSRAYKQVRLRFRHDASAERLREAWQEGIQENCGADCEAVLPKLREFAQILPDLKDGDEVLLDFHPAALRVSLNGAYRGQVADPRFSRSLLAIWLGEHPPHPDMKRGLLGERP